MRSIGIIGGSFDPVHLGHVNLAEDAKEQACLDEVWFMPTNIQPFKQDKKVAAEEHRLNMLYLAISGTEGLKVSTLEMELDGISYTYRTLRTVRASLLEDPHDLQEAVPKLYFIVGTDSFIKMSIWSHGAELLTENAIIVGSRPGYREEESAFYQNKYRELYGTEILVVHYDLLDISSTQRREKVLAGDTIHHLVPKKVAEYIAQKGLYK